MQGKHLGFFLAFALAFLPFASVRLGAAGLPVDLVAWLPLFVLFVLVPMADVLCGCDTSNEEENRARFLQDALFFRALVLFALPVWACVLVYAACQITILPLGRAGQLGWILSIGVLGGVLAITPAHELIHKSSRLERFTGGLLLASVGYHGFKIEHLRGHHVHVATPRDASSARLGESVYLFILRALCANLLAAWRIEAKRLGDTGCSAWSWRNEMLAWTGVWLLWLSVLALWLGPAALVFVAAVGLVSAISLEIINYVEHYGLSRSEIAPGRYERVTRSHSWNSSRRLSNWLLFNLQRHSDHHAHAGKRYPVLSHDESSPQLPAGYATMFVVALLPPLWWRIMNPRALATRQQRGG